MEDAVARPKPPEECASLDEVREAIDRLDRGIVAALGLRRGYVHAAARFKTDEASVRAPDRLAAMIAERRRWADSAGLPPDLVEHLFRDLVAAFTTLELAELHSTPQP
jgi:isochorismate pyruvate lyase